MEARLFADEHFDARVTDILRRRGHDVVTVRQIAQNKQGDALSDEEVLKYATQHKRVVLTDNVSDFHRLHEQIPWHEGIVACSVYADARAKANAINETLWREWNARHSFTGRWMRIPAEGENAGSTRRRTRKTRRKRRMR
jgi:hypothetical protein